MWGWLGSLSQQSANAAFPYTIGEERSSLSGKSIWKLHDGQKQADSCQVSIFIFEKAGASEDQVKLARSSFFRLKTLRHPNILRYIDGVELDARICVVTEAVLPLQDYLARNGDNKAMLRLAISWGVHQIAKGISFLNMDCNLCHAALCMAAVFVDVGGEWKIAGVDYLHTIGEAQPGPMIEYLAKYRPPGGKVSDGKVKWATDVWGLGCLIWEVFNHPLPQLSALKTVSQIPKQLIPSYCELVSANARSRPNAATFITNCRKPSGFMGNDFVSINLQLEEVQILDAGQKEALFAQLKECIDTFPESFQRNKILPILLQAFEFGEAGAAVLAPLFKLGKLLETEEYQSKIVPCVVKLFSSTDRGTRINLLQQLDLFVEHLQPSIVNEKIFPHVALGFNDTVPVMREHTIKSMLLLAPKLNEKTMNGELLRYFAKLQMDEQPGIRTNTTICLGKLAQYLNSATRLKVLHSAFTRGLKDPFPPARLASLRGMMVCSEYFADQDLATRLLPALCVLMVDKEKPVRDAAFETSAAFIRKLEDASAKRELSVGDDTSGGDAGMSSSSMAAAGSAASWAGWAVTSMTSKIYKPHDAQTDATSAAASAMTSTAQSKPPQPVAAGMSRPGTSSSAAPAAAPPVARSTGAQSEASDPAGNDDGEGWGDDDDDNWESIEESFTPTPASKSTAAAAAATKTTPVKSGARKGSTGNDSDAWDDGEWSSFDSPAAASKKPATDAAAASTRGASTKNSSTLAQKRSSSQPASGTAASASATAASAGAKGGGDGWGNDGDGWGADDDDADWGTALETSSAKSTSNLGASKAKESSSVPASSKAKKGAMSLKSSKPAAGGFGLDGFVKDDSMPTAASLFADSSSGKTSASASSKPAAPIAAKSTATSASSSSSAGNIASARTPSPAFAAAAEPANDGDGWGDTGDWGDHGDQAASTASPSASKAASSTAAATTTAAAADATTATTAAEKNAQREQRRAEQRKRQEAAKAKRAAATAAGSAKSAKIGGAMKLG